MIKSMILTSACHPQSATFGPFTTNIARTRQHILVPSQSLLIADIFRRSAFVYNETVRVHDSICRDRAMGRGTLECELRGKLAIYSAWKVDTLKNINFDYIANANCSLV